MLDGLFAITRDFDMQTQPHLLLLQKTMVMVEGIATQLDPAINMWDVSAPFVRELDSRRARARKRRLPTACARTAETLLRVPALVRRLEEQFPPRGGAPEPPPLPEIRLMWEGGGLGLLRVLSYAGGRRRGRCCGSRLAFRRDRSEAWRKALRGAWRILSPSGPNIPCARCHVSPASPSWHCFLGFRSGT